jgi:hypothetical protein
MSQGKTCQSKWTSTQGPLCLGSTRVDATKGPEVVPEPLVGLWNLGVNTSA